MRRKGMSWRDPLCVSYFFCNTPVYSNETLFIYSFFTDYRSLFGITFLEYSSIKCNLNVIFNFNASLDTISEFL